MRSHRLALALLLLAAAPAAAQPTGAPPPEGDEAEPLDTVMPPVDTEPVEPQPPPPVEQPPPPPAPAPEARAEPASRRPDAFSIGIGLGYDLPADLQAPNSAGVRFRLPSGLVLEPIVAIARSSDTVDTGDDTIESTDTVAGVSTFVRFPWQIGDRIDLELIGGAAVAYRSTNPDGADNDSSELAFGVEWGLGMTYWLTRHWTLSATATNPLFDYSTRTEEFGPDMETTTSGTEIGLVWAPDILAMVHLWF